MIKDNIVYLGYGDILVGCYNKKDELGQFLLTLTEIKPPQEVGSPVYKESIESGEIVIIQQSTIETCYEGIIEMKYCLEKLSAEGRKIIDFSNGVLDFTNFNEKSVKVFTDAIDRAINIYLQKLSILAC